MRLVVLCNLCGELPPELPLDKPPNFTDRHVCSRCGSELEPRAVERAEVAHAEKHALVALRAWVRGGASVEDLRAAGAVYVSAFDVLAHLEGRTVS